MSKFYKNDGTILQSDGATSKLLLDSDDICEGFVISSDGTYGASVNFGCSSFIRILGQPKITFTNVVYDSSNASNYGLVFYDENKNKVGFHSFIQGHNGIELETIDVPSNAMWLKFSFWNYANREQYGEFSCEIENGAVNGKRPYQSDLIFFSQKVNQSVDKFWETPTESVDFGESYKATTGVLLLPENYSPKGKKTPLIVYCHGYSHGVWYGTWGSTTSFLAQKRFWANLGFAVMDCNGAYHTTSASGTNNFGSSPQNVEAYFKCIQYVIQNYNVEDAILLVGGSMGGQVSMMFCYSHMPMVRAFALLEPHCNSRYWMQSNSFTEAMQTQYKALFGISDAEYSAVSGHCIDAPNLHERFVGHLIEDKIQVINEEEKILRFPPTRLWYGNTYNWGDGERTINAIRSAGGEATKRYIALGHSAIVSGNNEVVDTEVANFFKRY